MESFVVICPSCSYAAFLYEGGKVTVGTTVDISQIVGAAWKEPTIPACRICKYAFGPNDFKENRFKLLSVYKAENPNVSLPTGLRQNINGTTESVKTLHETSSKPKTLDPDFPQSASGVFDRVWEHFRTVMHKQAK